MKYTGLIMGKTNIALIGMLGVDKYAVGKELSLLLDMQFCDTDELVEYEHEKIEKLIKLFGIQGYKKYETLVISRVSGFENTVISTGFYAVNKTMNMEILSSSSIVVYLSASEKELLPKLKNVNSSLFVEKNPKDIKEKYREYKEKFVKYADLQVSISNKTTSAIVEEIVEKLVNYYKGK